MGLHQSNRFRHKYSKYSVYDIVKTLQASYIFSFTAKDRIQNMQYILYGNSNSICGVKTCFTKKNLKKQ